MRFHPLEVILFPFDYLFFSAFTGRAISSVSMEVASVVVRTCGGTGICIEGSEEVMVGKCVTLANSDLHLYSLLSLSAYKVGSPLTFRSLAHQILYVRRI